MPCRYKLRVSLCKATSLCWIIGAYVLSGFFASGSGCSFLPEWHGEWYQDSLGDVRISDNEIWPLGTCVQNVDSKYLVKSSTGNCYYCLVVTPQHDNIIEYKRSYCKEERNIADVCGTITGDYTLYTMIRVPSTPVPCPFEGPYTFTYMNMTNRVCDFPTSEVHACADDSRFKFRFRKCQDVPFTNTAEYDFQCLATWSAKNYLYGKFSNPNMYDKGQMYRCFIHNFQESPAQMAMSPDASCRGVTSSVSGVLNMKFIQDKEKWPSPMCDFPDFFTAEKRWRDLSGKFIIQVDRNGQRFKLLDNHVNRDVVRYTEETAEAKYSIKCIDKIDEAVSLSQFEYRTFTTNDSCISQYQCLRIYKRSPKVIELYIGSKLRNEHAACEQHNFANSTRYVFIPADSSAAACPLAGSYKFQDESSGCHGNFKVGCGIKAEEIQIETICPDNRQNVEILQCLHTWTEDQNIHVIVEKPGDLSMTGTCVTFGDGKLFQTVSTEQECNFMLPQILGKRISYKLQKPPETCKRDPRTLEGSTILGVIRDIDNVPGRNSANSLDSINSLLRTIVLTFGFVIVLFTDRLCLR